MYVIANLFPERTKIHKEKKCQEVVYTDDNIILRDGQKKQRKISISSRLCVLPMCVCLLVEPSVVVSIEKGQHQRVLG